MPALRRGDARAQARRFGKGRFDRRSRRERRQRKGGAAVGSGSGKDVGSGKEVGSGKGSGSGKGVAKSPSDVVKGGSNGAGTSGSGVNRQAKDGASGDGAVANPATKTAGAAVEEQIVFLCPNGHKLNAPQRLQGHAGQCPHCKATFRIPLVEQNTPASEKAQPTTESDEFTAFENGLLESAQDNGLAVEGYEMLSTVLSDAPAAGSLTGRTEAMPANAHPLARLVARLWNEREHGGIVELHLTGGALLVPEWFDAKLSHDSHGLFAVQAADGSVTMTIVPWDSVQRVVVRGVIGLPDGLFE